ncbi:hypothetical protein J2810_004856 [Chryseobacterium rhizosphaerae]|nr:hypothetical protein [Chryseobacterium rhizosphaerae]
MKWFFCIPYIMYQFFKQRNDSDNNAYMKGISIFTVLFFVYYLLLIPNSIIQLNNIFATISITIGITPQGKLVKYITVIIFFIFILLFIRKNKLDNLVFSNKEYRIAYMITGLAIWFPILLLIFLIMKTFSESNNV